MNLSFLIGTCSSDEKKSKIIANSCLRIINKSAVER